MSRTYRRDPDNPECGKAARDGRITLSSTPGWWVSLHMNRPKRRENTRLCRQVLSGAQADDLIWPMGNHRPHIWYW